MASDSTGLKIKIPTVNEIPIKRAETTRTIILTMNNGFISKIIESDISKIKKETTLMKKDRKTEYFRDDFFILTFVGQEF